MRRSRHHRHAEVAAIADWYTSQYPGRRGADDIAGGIEGVDGELHAIGWQPRVHVVHVAADGRLRLARLYLIFNAELSIEGFLCIVRRRCTSGGYRHKGREHEHETNHTHRRTSTPKTRNPGYRFRVAGSALTGKGKLAARKGLSWGRAHPGSRCSVRHGSFESTLSGDLIRC